MSFFPYRFVLRCAHRDVPALSQPIDYAHQAAPLEKLAAVLKSENPHIQYWIDEVDITSVARTDTIKSGLKNH